MKKLILTTIAMIFCAVSFAQEPEHLTFKGVPIDGTLSSFTQNLKTKGFSMIGQEGRNALMKGTFAGTDDCTLLVQTLDNKDLVYLVGVIFPDLDQWKLLNNQYMKLKEMLTQKYGKPASCVEKFQRNYIDDDKSRLHELKMDRCTYETIFETQKGNIKLALSHKSMLKCYVILGYVDAINGGKSQEDAYDDL